MRARAHAHTYTHTNTDATFFNFVFYFLALPSFLFPLYVSLFSSFLSYERDNPKDPRFFVNF